MSTIESTAVAKIKSFFEENDNRFEYDNQRGNHVTCRKLGDGIEVDCLGNNDRMRFLSWGVFWVAVNVMLENGGIARRGNAMNHRLGSVDLPFNSVEGRIASVIYGKQRGESVFCRISPIAHILIASGVCVEQIGDLELNQVNVTFGI